VEVASLVGPDADAHSFEPSPADARRLKDARVAVVNGLGFEGWVDRLVRASGTKATIVVASRGVKPIGDKARHGHGHAHDHEVDPHAWQDVANAKLYVANVRESLVKADPEGRAVYEANAARYLTRLDELDREVRAGIAAIPAGRREVIATHDAFAYFGRAYGLTFTAPQGISTGKDPNAADVRPHRPADQGAQDPGRVPGERVRQAPGGAHRGRERREDRRKAFIRTRSRRPAARPRPISR
jgi:zinc/manganese transport system substrate-binding protein